MERNIYEFLILSLFKINNQKTNKKTTTLPEILFTLQ